ncbi:unnamed protein product, partial [Ixodes pacificus]
NAASVKYDIDVLPPDPKVNCWLTLLDDQGWTVLVRQGCSGTFGVTNPKLWWPQGMHRVPGYQYTAKAGRNCGVWATPDPYMGKKANAEDVRVAIEYYTRDELACSVQSPNKKDVVKAMINDMSKVVKRFMTRSIKEAYQLFRKDHPHPELGISNISLQSLHLDEDEEICFVSFDSALLSEHKKRMTELVQRDKNRPSVIMWSVVNEPQSAKPQADRYFGELVAHVKTLDPTRPVTAALSGHYSKDLAGQYVDVIMYNKYAAWYTDPGSLQVIERQTISECEAMHAHYRKPIMISEYGADAVAGLHADPAFVFTEDFQAQLLLHHHKAFDQLRIKGYFVGEHVWNFADFMTDQDARRAFGNRKGIFTRNRQPKAAAKVLRCRYHKLSGRTIGDFDAYCPPS